VGEIAIDLGLLESADLLDALCLQEEQRNRGERVSRIGEILVGRGCLSPSDLVRVLEEGERRTWAIEIPGFHSLEHMDRDENSLHFQAVEKATEAPVTVKLFRLSLTDQPEEIGRFRRENAALARLDHPNLVRVLDCGDLEGVPYVVLEHVLAPNLQQVVSKHGPRSEAAALVALQKMALGMAHAHEQGIMHGSLRPRSILLTRLAGPKVADFTLREREALPAGRAGLPHYLSPEQARGQSERSVAGDIYSLGAIFFYLLTGRPPFTGSYLEILHHHNATPAPDPRTLAPGLSRGVARLTRDLLAKPTEKRPPSMDAVAKRAARLVARAGGRPSLRTA
jgi:serine/threonine protein kinase